MGKNPSSGVGPAVGLHLAHPLLVDFLLVGEGGDQAGLVLHLRVIVMEEAGCGLLAQEGSEPEGLVHGSHDGDEQGERA